MLAAEKYNARLTAGLGMLEETQQLLSLWKPGMNGSALTTAALESGLFPGSSARSLKNMIGDAFASRYLTQNGEPANLLKAILAADMTVVFRQLCLVFTCRAHRILADFITDVYWSSYAAGKDVISNEESLEFVRRINSEGHTVTPWTDSIQRRVASYLTGCCADFGLLESGMKKVRRILPFRIDARTVAVLAYERHFSGLSDNAVLSDNAWALFGSDQREVLSELQRWARRNLLLIQTGAELVKIDWTCKSMREVIHGVR